MVTVPFGNFSPIEGVVGMLPSEYRLYLESMMPSMNERPIGDEYFTNEMKDQIKDQVLNQFSLGNNKGLITEIDYQTKRNPMGTNDPSSLTGFNQLFNTLGSYQYDVVPDDKGGATVNITDRYDWNPDYGDKGYVGTGGTDVTTPMLLNQLYRQFILGKRTRRGDFDAANTLEMLGNYFGHRKSKGEGRDVKFSFPVTEEEILEYNKPEEGQNRGRQKTPIKVAGEKAGGDSKGPAGQVVIGNQVVQSPQQETQRIRSVLDARRRGANIGFSDGGLVSINDMIEVL